MFGYGNGPLRGAFAGARTAEIAGSSWFTSVWNWPIVIVIRPESGIGAPIGRIEQGSPGIGQVDVDPPITSTPDPLYGPAMLLVNALAASVLRTVPGGPIADISRSL